jgi:cytochrome P450
MLDPASFYKNGYPWQIWEKLRREDPIHHVAREVASESYWAVTRYRDIVNIERNTEVFKNSPRSTMGGTSTEGNKLRLVVAMDPPEHAAHRALAHPFFMPNRIEWVRIFAEEIVTDALDKAMARNGETIDLQEDIANMVPTAVVSGFLGAPRELWPRIIELTNIVVNAEDPSVAKDQDARVMVARATGEIIQMHGKTFADRAQNPRDDLMTALVTAEVDDRKLTQLELASWAIILTLAGHETTQSTFTLAVHALLKNPDQFSKLKENPALLPAAIDEFLRYTSPAIHFVRTPDRDVELHGKKIRAGEHMVMFYPSANRDSDIFKNPDQFDIARSPNPHLAFGVGPHQCLGMHLARLELKVMFEQFLQRVDTIEMVGTPENVYSNSTSGFKHFPVRLKIRPKF